MTKEEKKAYKAAYYQANREKIIARSATWSKANKDKMKVSRAKWQKNNPEKVKTIQKRHGENNHDRILLRNRGRYNDNPERARAYSTKWRKNNKTKVRKTLKTWRSNNKKQIKEYSIEWRRLHPGATKKHDHAKRAKRRSCNGELSLDISTRLLAFQKNRCAICRTSLKKTGYHLDHIIPLARGGKNTDGNIQVTCPKCNMEKHAKDPIQFMQERGFLL
jgi:5-methylcytosine-specific restriction endonuclease McrA